MRWWSQEYLNEGFARLMQSYGSDDLVPEWDVMGLTGKSDEIPLATECLLEATDGLRRPP